MNIDKNKILKLVLILAIICIVVSSLTKVAKQNSYTLQDYANDNPEIAYQQKETEESTEATSENDSEDATGSTQDMLAASDALSDTLSDALNETNSESTYPGTGSHNSTGMNNGNDGNNGSMGDKDDNGYNGIKTENLQNADSLSATSTLTGAILNGETVKDQRITYAENFYYEPLSDNLRRYITGVSYPSPSGPVSGPADAETEETSDSSSLEAASTAKEPAISYEKLCYLHILHYDFDGNLAEGELICNQAIAQDLVEIFYELYRNEYQLEKVHLIDEYDGDDIASMEDNNTSCFNYRVVEGSTSLSKHALGLAIDINPLYNPYITYEKDGSEKVSPTAGAAYADRSVSFPYKIDENDLCYKLFIQHGFTWGGNWNSCKDYQHFQKTVN